MKEPEEYLRLSTSLVLNELLDQHPLLEDNLQVIIETAQKDAIEHTLKVAAELTEDRLKNEPMIKSFVIDGDSILSLKDELFKSLENEK